MVSLEVEIEPGVGSVQFPSSGGNTGACHFFSLFMIGQPLMRSDPDTIFVRIHLTHSVPASAALTIAGMFGALRNGTEKTHMLNAAITAMLTIKQGSFRRIFQA